MTLVLPCSSPARFELVEGSITDYSGSRLAAREPDPAMLPP